MRYLALGDSYTIGEGVDPEDRWPNVLAQRLRRAGHDLEDPRIIATTGWTTDELAAAMDQEELAPTYDLVSLLIGVNNQYRGRECELFRTELANLVRRAIGLAGSRANRVLLVSIPDWTITPFFKTTDRDLPAERKAMASYNQACRETADATHVHYANVTDDSNAMADDDQLVTEDGLHPSAALYRRWVDRIYPIASAALTSSS